MRDATPELQDAVAQARDGVWGALEDWQNTTRTTAQVHRDLNSALDALIAAVREADFAAAERYAHTAMQAGGPLLDNLARAYLALLAHLKPPLNNTAAEVKSELNAAVSWPAEARGEPEYAEVSDKQIIAHLDSLAALRMDSIGADAWHLAFKRAAYAMRQLHTHPAPSGGEEVTPDMVKVALDEADRDLREGETFASVLAASLNSQMAAPSGGDAAPRPEPGEPSEAMVEAFIEAFHAGGSATYRDDIRRSLRAALAAQRVKP